MKISKIVGFIFCLTAFSLQAQQSNEVEQLRKQLQEVQAQFEKTQREQKMQIEALTRKLEELTQSLSVPAEESHDHDHAHDHERSHHKHETDLVQQAHPIDSQHPSHDHAFLDIELIGTVALGTSTARDIEGGLQLGGHDPNQRGFTLQGVEAVFSGAIDPYFQGAAHIMLSLDSRGESYIELEEAWLETFTLPGNLKFRGGQILTEFGRHNILHPHTWSFVDAPLANARLLGPDGLRNPGVRIYWQPPALFQSEFSVGIQSSQGETASSFRSSGHSHGDKEEDEMPFAYRHPDNDRGVRAVDDLLISARYATSLNLTDEQTLHAGASAALGPNSSGESGNNHTRIFGVDLTWKWISPDHHRGFPFVSWQTEGLLRQYRAGAFDWDEDGNLGDADGNGNPDHGVLVDSLTGLPAVLSSETLVDYGFYSQISYGFRPGWIVGLRYDYVTSDRGDYERRPLMLADNSGGGMLLGRDAQRNTRWRISPNLTWFPTEFSKVRLQYNYDERRNIGSDHSVWLQLEFLLGTHSAHD